jgi:cyclase
MNKEIVLPTSKYFTLEMVADGIYALYSKEGSMARSNAGIISLGARTWVVDTFYTPQAAYDLRAAAEKLTGHPVSMVVNTHFHNDHVWGNQVFSQQTDIIASDETYKIMAQSGSKGVDTMINNANDQLRSLESQLKETQDETRRQELKTDIADTNEFLEILFTITPRLPNMTFSSNVFFYGKDRYLELIAFEKGHAPGNSIVYLPHEGIVFVGDLLFNKSHPYMADCDTDSWIEDLKAIEEFNPKHIIPGHGPEGTLEDIVLLQHYLADIKHKVEEAIQAGKGEGELDNMKVPKAFSQLGGPERYTRNLHVLYRRMSAHAS